MDMKHPATTTTMDLLQLPYVLLSLGFLLLLTLIKRVYKPSSLNLPPGPWKLPIIGSIHHLLTALPHRAFRLLAQQHGPLMFLRLGQVDVVVVSSREAASEIMKSQDINFCSRPKIPVANMLTYGSTDIAFSPYGDHWRQLKKICIVELLSANRVRSFQSLFEEEISKLIEEIYTSGSGSHINLSSMLAVSMTTIVARCTIGSKSDHHGELEHGIKDMLKLVSGFNLVDLFPHVKYLDILTGIKSKIERVHGNLDEILGGVIKEHELKHAKSRPAFDEVEDLVDILLRIKTNGELEIPLTNDNIKAVILDMFAGGSETTSTVLSWAMSELIMNPRVMEKANAEVRRVLKGKAKVDDKDIGELDYLNMVIKETMRLHTPVPLLAPREALNTCQVGGYSIPAGTRVVVNAWALGRDPRYWDDAEEFKPERFSGSAIDIKGTNFEFVPFGSGRRMCPGMTFGSAIVGYTLAQLLFHFNWELPNGVKPKELDMTESFGVTAARKTDIFLLATPYLKSKSCFL